MSDFTRPALSQPPSDTMIDPFGRAIGYVRVSVTDRCDFRCVYCMAEDMTFLPKKDLLTLEELDRLCSAFIDLGVRKIRLTGGEPLVRRNIMSLVRSLGRHLQSGALEDRPGRDWLSGQDEFLDEGPEDVCATLLQHAIKLAVGR